ncbi:MAG: beta-ketoacyl-[acyl-carrier-protein] synthase family protein [Janthinobacterium lividum]
MRRVVVTGAGCVTAIGHDVESFRQSLFAGRSGIRPIADERANGVHFKTLAEVQAFRPGDWLTAAQKQLAERSASFAIAAGRQAVEQSRLCGAYEGDSIALILGCSTGGRWAEEPQLQKLFTEGTRTHPLTVPRSMANAGTSLLSMEHGITGPAYTVSTACASAAHAIGQAFHMVRSGSVEAAVTGGHEAPLTYGFLRAWDSLHVVSPAGCKPFAADRDGMTLGEGAALFALETLERAQQRGAPILGEIVGFGMSSDARHMTQAHASGPVAAMRRALLDAQSGADEVDYINAHGTGTEVNDRVEAEALHDVFGERSGTLAVSSTKGLHGHAMGASGAMELLSTLLSLREGLLPANAGSENVDSALRLGGVLLQNRQMQSRLALSNSFAFGGLNAVLAVKPVL